jgi:uncharacterized membrane protein
MKNYIASLNSTVIASLLASALTSLGQTWSPLGSGLDAGNCLGTVNALLVFGGDLYAGGNFNVPGGTLHIARWDGTQWNPVGSGVNKPVNALAVLNGNRFVGGDFETAGGITVNKVAKWDGTTWSALGTGLQQATTVFALATKGTRVYVGGSFTSAGNVPGTANIAYWDTADSQWHPMGSGLGATVRAIAVADNGIAYAGGDFAEKVAQWSGTAWSGLPDPPSNPGFPLWIYSLATKVNDLYVGGQFSQVGSTPGIAVRGLAKWNGSAWSGFGTELWRASNLSTSPGAVRAIAWNGSQMYVTGSLVNAVDGNQPNHLFMWASGMWSPSVPSSPVFGVGVGCPNPYGLSLAVDGFAGRVYVGGFFDTAGGFTSHRVAVWNDFQPYTITDLGTLSASTYAYGLAVNKNGLATGYSQASVSGSFRDHVFSSIGDGITDLGSSGPWGSSDNTYANGINDSSVFVGTADYFGSGTLIRAFRNFLPGSWTLLEGFQSGAHSEGVAINKNGDAVGFSQNSSSVDRATLWKSTDTTGTDLQSLAGQNNANVSYANGINKDGYIVGKSYYTGGNTKFHAFQNTAPYAALDSSADLGSMGGASKESIAYALNDFKQVVGSSQDSGSVWRAFIKAPNSGTGSGFTDLGAGANSSAYAINNSGQVVGTVANSSAFIWQNDLGYKNLQSLLPTGSQWTLISAEAINDNGTIVGWGYNNAVSETYVHGFIMTP